MSFNGFTNDTLTFLNNLKNNNNKEWFDANRTIYDEHLLKPSKEFVIDLGKEMIKLFPQINAIPKVNQSLFKINRDIRFSNDKSPYKTHLGILLWDGTAKKMESPGFYFHLECDRIIFYSGLYQLNKEQLENFRSAVVDKKYGNELIEISNEILAYKNYKIGGSFYKRLPKGYPENSLNADFLLFNALWAEYEIAIPDEFFSEKIVNKSVEIFKDFSKLHNWLKSIL